MQSGGRINLNKAAEIVIHDFRSAVLGRITLETPEQFAQWLAEGKQIDAERQMKKTPSRWPASSASRRSSARHSPAIATSGRPPPAKVLRQSLRSNKSQIGMWRTIYLR